jgi:hypothetical protein
MFATFDGFTFDSLPFDASPSSPPPPAAVRFEVDLLAYLGPKLDATVYVGHVPQGRNLPAVTYTLVGEDSRSTLKSAAGLTARTYQFSFFSLDQFEVIDLEAAARSVLLGFRGMMGTTLVTSCRLQDAMDMPYQDNVDASDFGTYQRIAEYRIFLKESVPTF